MNNYKLIKIEKEIVLKNGGLLTKLTVQDSQGGVIPAIIFGRESLTLSPGQSFTAHSDNNLNDRGEIKNVPFSAHAAERSN